MFGEMFYWIFNMNIADSSSQKNPASNLYLDLVDSFYQNVHSCWYFKQVWYHGIDIQIYYENGCRI